MDYTSTKMRIAGNIAAGLVAHPTYAERLTNSDIRPVTKDIAYVAVAIATDILARVRSEQELTTQEG